MLDYKIYIFKSAPRYAQTCIFLLCLYFPGTLAIAFIASSASIQNLPRAGRSWRRSLKGLPGRWINLRLRQEYKNNQRTTKECCAGSGQPQCFYFSIQSQVMCVSITLFITRNHLYVNSCCKGHCLENWGWSDKGKIFATFISFPLKSRWRTKSSWRRSGNRRCLILSTIYLWPSILLQNIKSNKGNKILAGGWAARLQPTQRAVETAARADASRVPAAWIPFAERGIKFFNSNTFISTDEIKVPSRNMALI